MAYAVMIRPVMPVIGGGRFFWLILARILSAHSICTYRQKTNKHQSGNYALHHASPLPVNV
ncbi:hypothetical protein ApDm4_2496 [Acetobacter pomorum]|nr:hypothetical protein ApDm4_2496 [Acetobacter pomorum]